MNKRAALFRSNEEKTVYTIRMGLQEGRTATFEYSDRTMAREHYDQLRFYGVVGSSAIKEISFEENVRKT